MSLSRVPSSLTVDSLGFAFVTALAQKPSESVNEINQSKALSEKEKLIYKSMIDCVALYGDANDQELFKAAGFCFDLHLGFGTRNIFRIRDFVELMGETVQKTLGENEVIEAGYFAHDRPGFFLISNGTVRFLKEGEDGAIMLFDPHQDIWVKSSTLPTTGDEKMVVLNRDKFQPPKAYIATETRGAPAEGRFYHEEQDMGKCVIHSFHALLGYPVIHENHLSMMNLEIYTQAEVSGHLEMLKCTRGIPYLPRGQLTALTERKRFEAAQTKFYQSQFGNDISSMPMFLKYLSSEGLIEDKYKNATCHKISLSDEELANNIEFSELLRQFDEKLASSQHIWEPLFKEMEETKQWDYEQFMRLSWNADPYRNLKLHRDRIEATIVGLKELQEILCKGDRLMVGTLKPAHAFTLRKNESGEWHLIDSLLPDQTSIPNPFHWLIENFGYHFHFIGF
jgi:hypothetical protein